MTHDFSPIDSEAKYKAALEYLFEQGSKMAKTALGQSIVPDTLTIFTHTKKEYDYLDKLIRTYGTKSRFSHNVTLYVDTDLTVAGHPVKLIGIREPDDSRKEVGYADFPVSDYEEIRNTKHKYVHEITTSRGQSLLELMHPDFDIRGYLVAEDEHGSLFAELSHAVEEYHTSWHTFIAERTNKEFFEHLKPTAVAWKVFDRAELDRCIANLRDMCDQIHSGWVNERWLVTLHLKDEVLPGSIRIIKLMERRPGSSDPVGLDHLDFFIPKGGDAKSVVTKEPSLKWSEEKNGEHCKWLSLWFDNREAKLRTDTVLQVCADELLDYQKQSVKS